MLHKDRPEVLFVCVHNAGRSQMAAGLLKLRSGGGIVVRSAGSAPAEGAVGDASALGQFSDGSFSGSRSPISA